MDFLYNVFISTHGNQKDLTRTIAIKSISNSEQCLVIFKEGETEQNVGDTKKKGMNIYHNIKVY